MTAVVLIDTDAGSGLVPALRLADAYG